MGLFSKPVTITPQLLKEKGFRNYHWGNPHRWDHTNIYYSKILKWRINDHDQYVELLYFPKGFTGYANIRTFDSHPLDDYIRHPQQRIALSATHQNFDRIMETTIETFDDMELAVKVYKQALIDRI